MADLDESLVCFQTVSEFNNLVALYRELVISIGETATDCASVRGEMCRTRTGACETARAAHHSLSLIPGYVWGKTHHN